MDGFQGLPLDTLKLLFSKIDISLTVKRIENKYANSGRERPRYTVRSMLLALMFMRFEAVPSPREKCAPKHSHNSYNFDAGLDFDYTTRPIVSTILVVLVWTKEPRLSRFLTAS